MFGMISAMKELQRYLPVFIIMKRPEICTTSITVYFSTAECLSTKAIYTLPMKTPARLQRMKQDSAIQRTE